MIERNITHIVLHCSATRSGQNIGRKEIHDWHVERGFAEIGYHFVVRRTGRIETGRDIAKKGAHAKGFNSASIGICVVGGLATLLEKPSPMDNFTPASMNAAAKLVLKLMTEHDIRLANVLGHNEVVAEITRAAPTACPVFSMNAFRERVSTLVFDRDAHGWGLGMADDDEFKAAQKADS